MRDIEARVEKGKKSDTSKLVLRITAAVMRVLLNVVFYVVVVILVIRGTEFAYEFAYQVFGNETVEVPPGRDVQIQIKKNESTMNVAGKLEVSKLVKNKYSFYLKTKLKGKELMPGIFALNTSMTYDEILAVITDHKQSLDYEETIKEETESKKKKSP